VINAGDSDGAAAHVSAAIVDIADMAWAVRGAAFVRGLGIDLLGFGRGFDESNFVPGHRACVCGLDFELRG
jgi:hypothetical protein